MLRIGIAGIGNMGSAHAIQLAEGRVAGACLAAVCDCSPERLAWAGQRFGPDLAQYIDYSQMLAEGGLDAVLIATPHRLHPPMACDAFEKGLAVLTEKPAGIDIVGAEQMNRAAASSGRPFGIMYNQRTNPLFQKLRRLVRDGALGEIKRFVWIVNNWYRTQAYYDSGDWRATWNGEGGGVLLNQCPHNLDIWQWILGMPASIQAFCREGQYHRISVEDDAVIYGEYESGATALFVTSTGEYPGTNRLEISGTRGKAVAEDGELKLFLLDQDERRLCVESKEGMPREPVHITRIPQGETDSGHLKILQNFTDHILRGEPLLAPGREGINGLMLSNAAYLSSWKGGRVELPLDGQEFLTFLCRRQAREAQQSQAQTLPPKSGVTSCRTQAPLSAAAPSAPQTSLSGTELLPPGAAVRENLSGEYQDRWKVNW